MFELQIDFFELEDAMTWNNDLSEDQRYLNIKTGEVYFFDEEVVRAVEDGTEEELLDWQLDEVEVVKEFLSNQDDYIVIPKVESRESYRWMQEFIETLKDDSLADKLADSINRSRPFRRFKDTLIDHGSENEAWFEFYSRKVKEEASLWLRSRSIIPCWAKRE